MADFGAAIIYAMDLLEMALYERDRQVLLGLLQALERSGTVVKRPAKVIPFPKPQPKP
jgi:hypothetical protein